MAFEVPKIPRIGFPKPGQGSAGARLVWFLGAVLVVGVVGYNSCTTYVRPGEAGVKQISYGMGKGIEPFVYGVGLHFVGLGERMHLFPTYLQILELTNSRAESMENGPGHRVTSEINIQTSEGYNVRVDATVLYRIAGELDAEDFYRGNKRMEKAREAQEALSTELADKGIEIVQVFVRRYVYDAPYQNAIEMRKIQDQTVYKNEAEAKAAIANAAKNKIIAEGAAAVQVELSRGEAEVKKLDAEADLYRRKKAADADLLVRLAEAKGTELQSQALRAAGAENLVGLRMAEALQGTQIIVLPSDGESGMNPLDLKSLLKRFDVRQ
jgi:regulator of protease activity HflC (stomatin/prohibitin superfamily)